MTNVTKYTPMGKAIRTAVQAFVIVGPLVTGILALPEVRELIEAHVIWLVPIVLALIAIVTYLQNKYEKQP